jgi:glycosyltransferase involved in cell wall biosynthesis
MSNNVGLSYAPGDADEMVKAVTEPANDKNLWNKIRQNAVRLARYFDRNVLAKRTTDLMKVVAKNQLLPEIDW